MRRSTAAPLPHTRATLFASGPRSVIVRRDDSLTRGMRMTNARWLVVVLLLVAAAACSRPAERGQVVERKEGPVTLELESPPAPPVTGTNTITVLLKGGDGTPIGDAVVTGELFMPVMESMGKSVVVFRPEGSGRYVGAGTLSM